MKLNRILLLSLGMIATLLASSCSRIDDIDPYPPQSYDRVVIVYMVAQNSLTYQAYHNMNSILEGMSDFIPGKKYAVVVYCDPRERDSEFPQYGTVPRVIELVVQPDRKLSRNVMKVYDEQNSASPQVMSGVLDDIIEMYPASEYGLMLWGHGSGWLPKNYTPPTPINSEDRPKRAFGDDGSAYIDIDELKTAIPDDTFNFIIFDVCYMAGVEVAYQLRNKADYIIASATEVMDVGYPYDKIIPRFYQPTVDLPAVCQDFYDYYRTRSSNPYATVSLVKTSELPALAGTVKDIISAPSMPISNINLNNIQIFGRDSFISYFYDLDNFMQEIAPPMQYYAFQSQMDKTVLYKANTPFFAGLVIRRHCGLSSYIYRGRTTIDDQYYKTLDWYEAVYN